MFLKNVAAVKDQGRGFLGEGQRKRKESEGKKENASQEESKWELA